MSGVWGIGMVKDEADVIEATVGHMLEQVDRVLVADNMSSDGTWELLTGMVARAGGRLNLVRDQEVGYYQARKMTRLADFAGETGASWVVPFDADEVWSSPFGRIGTVLEALPAVEGIARATLFDHVTTDLDDPTVLDPTRRIGWRRVEPGALPKVACRPIGRVQIQQGNHGAFYPGMAPNPVLEVRHFPYRSDGQFVRKVRNGAAAYAATDLPDDAGAHWRGYGKILEERGEAVLVEEVYRKWFHESDPASAGLVYDPAR